MAELTAEDVEAFTNGRLTDDGGTGEVTRMLKAALTVARRYTGWVVSPVEEAAVFILDGPGGRKLHLPTGKILSVNTIEEDGDVTDSSVYAVSANVPGLVVRKTGRWTRELAGITATVDHGYTEEEAADWRQAILTMVDQMSRVSTVQGVGPLIRKKIDDVEYQWSDTAAAAEEALFSVCNVLDFYRLMPVYFS